MAEIQWWYARGDEQLGPVSAADLRRLAASGALSQQTLVWREGMAEWVPALRLKGLFAEPGAAAPVEAPGRAEAADVSATASVAMAPVATAPPLATAEAPANSYGALESLLAPPPAAPPETPAAAAISDVPTAGPSERPRISRTRLTKILLVAQAVLWAMCVLMILFGGLLFTIAHWRAKTPADEAAAAAVYATFFIGAYVIARAGEKLSALVMRFIDAARN